jgi:glycerophosphoryl diester phosphodiesterase
VVELYAHRGSGTPQNSLSAIQHALKLGATGVEIDVHQTSDGVWILNHDADIHGRLITKHTARELQAICPITTLDEVLNFQKTVKYHLNIELKVMRPEPAAYGKSFARYLEDYNDLEGARVSSFSAKVLHGIHLQSPSIPLALLDVIPKMESVKRYVRKFSLRAYNPNHLLLRPSHVQTCHKLGVEVHPWTVNSAKRLRKVLDLQVDAIITDEIPLALNILSQHKN